MIIKSFIGTVCALVLICGTSIANAASINFSSPSMTANVNDIITLDVLMDFTGNPTLGGGTDIFYDSAVLSYQSFSFATTSLTLDPAFSRTPDILSNKLEGLAFGNFNGLSGPGTVGTLTFQVIASGNTTLRMAETTSALGGGRSSPIQLFFLFLHKL